MIWAGDINIDLNPKNDTNMRADVRELLPILNECINSNDLVLINKEPTWFRPGRKKSLLDLFLLDHPQHVLSCKNVINITSKHAGVLLQMNLNLEIQKQQFITVRNYRNITWENIEPILANDNDLNTLFSNTDPDIVADKLLRGLNNIVNSK